MSYPQARRSDQVDTYHGVAVADPYRWLEDPDSPETRAWVEAENRLTFAYLEQIPARKSIRDRLTKLCNYERFGVPIQEGGRYFYTSLGSPEDFQQEGLKRLLANAVFWTSGRDGGKLR